jgi:4'-phosphopantetheinyl transferase
VTAPRFVSPTEIHVWSAQLDSPAWPSVDRLPADERGRAERLQRPRTRRRWIASRWALRAVLARYLEQTAAEVALKTGAHGKPALVQRATTLRFNLSHSAGRALVAVSAGPEVGVDLERIDPRRNLDALASRLLGPEEAASLERGPGTALAAAVHAAWTRREARVKCLGVGLGKRLPDHAVSISNIDAGSGYAAALAVAGDEGPQPRRFAVDQLGARPQVSGV